MKKIYLIAVMCLCVCTLMAQEASSQEMKRFYISPLVGQVSSEALYFHAGAEISMHVSQYLSIYANYRHLFLELDDDSFGTNDPMSTTSLGIQTHLMDQRMKWRFGCSYNKLTALPTNYIEGVGLDIGLNFDLINTDWYDFGAGIQETYILESQKGLFLAELYFNIKL